MVERVIAHYQYNIYSKSNKKRGARKNFWQRVKEVASVSFILSSFCSIGKRIAKNFHDKKFMTLLRGICIAMIIIAIVLYIFGKPKGLWIMSLAYLIAAIAEIRGMYYYYLENINERYRAEFERKKELKGYLLNEYGISRSADYRFLLSQIQLKSPKDPLRTFLLIAGNGIPIALYISQIVTEVFGDLKARAATYAILLLILMLFCGIGLIVVGEIRGGKRMQSYNSLCNVLTMLSFKDDRHKICKEETEEEPMKKLQRGFSAG